MLKEKVDTAIAFLRKAEKLALKMQPEHGFWLSFSGGKDSCVILKLAEMAGVKFTAYYNVTTIDPPEVVRFIIEQHPEVVRIHPELNFFALIKKKQFLPTRDRRYCCEVLKEKSAAGYCQILGIRKYESIRREKKWTSNVMQFKSAHQANAKDIDEMNDLQFQCVGGKDTIKINPILTWTDNDVWSFIKEYNVPYCKLYDQGRTRIGCLFCPYARKKERKKERYNKLSQILPIVEKECCQYF